MLAEVAPRPTEKTRRQRNKHQNHASFVLTIALGMSTTPIPDHCGMNSHQSSWNLEFMSTAVRITIFRDLTAHKMASTWKYGLGTFSRGLLRTFYAPSFSAQVLHKRKSSRRPREDWLTCSISNKASIKPLQQRRHVSSSGML